MLEKLLRGGSTQAPPELPLAFTLEGEKRLRIQQDYSPLNAWRFLSHQVRRYPQDLRIHTQRVLLTQSEALRERLAGSLQDVFITLGNAGQHYREHLLALVKDDLDQQDQAFFTEWVAQGGSFKGSTSQWRMGSVLASGQEKPTARLLHVERSQEVAQYSNVMEEVIACLEYGQVDAARELLEAEMFAGSADEAMEQELVNIYQYTRDKERLDAMIKHQEDAGRTVSAVWREKQQESESW